MAFSVPKRVHKNQLVFKGLKHGLTLIIPEEKPFSFWLEVLYSQLTEARTFFHGALINVELGARKLTKAEEESLKRTLSSFSIIAKSFTSQSAGLNRDQREEGKGEGRKISRSHMVHGTVRNGQRIEYDGNIIVKGDVNPGAEIVAAGDIVILGRLRGIAHAGVKGNDQAEVIAMLMNPVQIRIGNYFSRSPETGSKRNCPEIARVRQGKIVVERFDANQH